MAVNCDFAAVGDQFSKFYYQLFQNDRNQLTTLYSETSCLTFENDCLMGKDAIVKKLANLPFGQVKIEVGQMNPQPIIGIDNGKAVFVTIVGKIFVDEDPPKMFTQTFLLRPADADASGYFIANETFRLGLFD